MLYFGDTAKWLKFCSSVTNLHYNLGEVVLRSQSQFNTTGLPGILLLRSTSSIDITGKLSHQDGFITRLNSLYV